MKGSTRTLIVAVVAIRLQAVQEAEKTGFHPLL
jgi:hypothetical protein